MNGFEIYTLPAEKLFNPNLNETRQYMFHPFCGIFRVSLKK
jgi:hypothetical protein